MVLLKHIVVEAAPSTAKEDSATLMHWLYTDCPACDQLYVFRLFSLWPQMLWWDQQDFACNFL